MKQAAIGTPYLSGHGRTCLFASDRPTNTACAGTANLHSVAVSSLCIDCNEEKTE